MILRFLHLAAVFLLLVVPMTHALAADDPLDAYVKRLREDSAGPRKETGFLSAGSDFLSGQDALQAKNYGSAAFAFGEALRKQEDNIFARYQLAIALLHDTEEARRREGQRHLEQALAANGALRARLAQDLPTAAQRDAAKAAPAAAADAQSPAPAGTTGSLDAYIAFLKESQRTGGAATAMNTAGREALYGIEYYEARNFDSAVTNFQLALPRDRENPFLHYLLAVSLAAQGKDDAAEPHYRRATDRDGALAARYARDVAAAKAAWTAKLDAKKTQSTPAAPVVHGGALVFGNYTCSKTVWNGPNAVPAYRSEYQGYFELKSDGSYRWLDHGATGRYRYDEKSGEIVWLSGYFKDLARSSRFRRDGRSGSITLEFSENLRWNCFCEKK